MFCIQQTVAWNRPIKTLIHVYTSTHSYATYNAVCHYTLYTSTGKVNLGNATCLQIDLEYQHNITGLLVYYYHCNVSIQ